MLDAGLEGALWVTCSLQAPERQRGPGRIATAIRPAISRDRSPSQSTELHTPLSQLVRGCASPRQTALASTAYPLPAGKDVFLNFGPVSSDAGPLRSYRVCRMRCRRGFRVRAASRLRSSLSANRWLNRSPASLPLSLSMRSWNGLRTWSKVIRDASSRYAAAPAYVPGMAASFSHGAVRRSSSDCGL